MEDYLKKGELTKRWSPKLIEKYFPICTQEEVNPHCRWAAPMQLYDVNEVARIEKTERFKADFEKVLKRKESAQKAVHRKRDELIRLAENAEFTIPTIEKDKLINKACDHYNWHNSWQEDYYGGFNKATPSSSEDFLMRITINYLRHQCTCYDDRLGDFYKKVGVQEAHDILKSRINEAIKQKYEWLQ